MEKQGKIENKFAWGGGKSVEEIEKFSEKEFYREKIIEMVNEIDNIDILAKIFTYVKTHLKILKGEI